VESGYLSMETAKIIEREPLQQFEDDRVQRIGDKATVRIPMYGMIVYRIRSSTLNMDKFEEHRARILQDSRPFIPQAEMNHIRYLTRNIPTNAASSITVQCAKAENTYKIVNEGVVS
jgi:hypothetical protein